ncbi:MAG TPA: MbnP family copper-binding protein [Methylococcaceae bacterium]|nr:MbnP family copper-binding protein [Methylococcaceae bacterium]
MRIIALYLLAAALPAAETAVTIRFGAAVNGRPFACGQSYSGVGTAASTISARDFRFYVHNVRLVDETGAEARVRLPADGKWQGEETALLDFENATGPCSNGTPETNDRISGSIDSPPRAWRGLRFTVGVPFAANHQELTSLPSPLNLRALSWVWNAGHKFARLDISIAGQTRGFAIHLGSTGCTPSTTRTTVPTTCSEPNRIEVDFPVFDVAQDVVLADLGALLANSDLAHADGGCMSDPGDDECGPLFGNFGLPFRGKRLSGQQFLKRVPGGRSADASE